MVVQWMRSDTLAPTTTHRAPDQRSVIVGRRDRVQTNKSSLVSGSAIPQWLSSNADNVRP